MGFLTTKKKGLTFNTNILSKDFTKWLELDKCVVNYFQLQPNQCQLNIMKWIKYCILSIAKKTDQCTIVDLTFSSSLRLAVKLLASDRRSAHNTGGGACRMDVGASAGNRFEWGRARMKASKSEKVQN